MHEMRLIIRITYFLQFYPVYISFSYKYHLEFGKIYVALGSNSVFSKLMVFCDKKHIASNTEMSLNIAKIIGIFNLLIIQRNVF